MSSQSFPAKLSKTMPTGQTDQTAQTIDQLKQALHELQLAYDSQAEALLYERKKRTFFDHYLREHEDFDSSLLTKIDDGAHAFAADSANYYKDIVENQIDLICRFLPDGTVTFANQAFIDFFGRPLDEIVGQSYQSLILPEDRANLDAYLRFLSKQHSVGDIEHRVLRQQDGEEVCSWLQWRSRALFAADGQIQEFQAVGRDITQQKNKDLVQEIRFNYLRKNFVSQTSELKHATAQLAKTAKKQKHTEKALHLYQQAVKSSSDMVLIIDDKGHVLFANHDIKCIDPPHTPSEIQGKYFADLLPAENKEAWLSAYDQALHGYSLRIDIDCYEKTFEFALSPMKYMGPNNHVVVFARDVTIRKYTEVAFEQSNDELRRMILELGALNRIAHIIATEDLTVALPEAASRIRNLFNVYSTTIALYDREQESFQILADVRQNKKNNTRFSGQIIKLESLGISPSDLDEHRTQITSDQLGTNRLAQYFVQQINYKKVGNFTLIPLLVRQQVIGYIIITIRDLNRQFQVDLQSLETIAQHIATYIDNARLLRKEKQQRKKLEAQNSDLDAFTRMVAHDLKSPLHTIVGFSDMLIQYKDYFDETQKEDLTRRITEGAKRMGKIIDELLLLAQIGRISIEKEIVNMERVITHALDVNDHLRKQFDGEIVLPPAWPEIESYSPWLAEIWSNYISNGIKYGGRPYHLELGFTELKTNHIRFWIKDNGEGIEQDDIDKLFVEFQRLSGAKELPGTGLGLAIVKRIVEHLGGAVGVHSVIGEGTVFYFDLPLRAIQNGE